MSNWYFDSVVMQHGQLNDTQILNTHGMLRKMLIVDRNFLEGLYFVFFDILNAVLHSFYNHRCICIKTL